VASVAPDHAFDGAARAIRCALAERPGAIDRMYVERWSPDRVACPYAAFGDTSTRPVVEQQQRRPARRRGWWTTGLVRASDIPGRSLSRVACLQGHPPKDALARFLASRVAATLRVAAS
jgi:hypothetical protein